MSIKFSYSYLEEYVRVAREVAIARAQEIRSDLKVFWDNGSHLFLITDKKNGMKGNRPLPETAEELEKLLAEYNDQYPDTFLVGVEVILNGATDNEAKARYEKATEFVDNEECEFCIGAADCYIWQRL